MTRPSDTNPASSRQPHFVGPGNFPDSIHLFSYLTPEPILAPPTSLAPNRTVAFGRVEILMTAIWTCASLLFLGAAIFMLDTAVRYHYKNPPPSAPNRSPIPVFDLGSAGLVLFPAAFALASGSLALISATSRIRVDFNADTRTVHIARRRLLHRTELSESISKCTLFISPHTEVIYGRTSQTIHIFTVLLSVPNNRPIVLFASHTQQGLEKSARATVTSARQWMSILGLDCTVVPDPHLSAATRAQK